MKKLGRPKIGKKQNRMSISFSDNAWALIESMKNGQRSFLISLLIEKYASEYSDFFIRKLKNKCEK